jgi:hypothetical protein
MMGTDRFGNLEVGVATVVVAALCKAQRTAALRGSSCGRGGGVGRAACIVAVQGQVERARCIATLAGVRV